MKTHFKVRYLPKKNNRGRKPSRFRDHSSPDQCEGVVHRIPSKGGDHRCLNQKMQGSNYCKRHSGTWNGATNHKFEYDATYWKAIAKEFARQIEQEIPTIDSTHVKAYFQSIVAKFKNKLEGSHDQK